MMKKNYLLLLVFGLAFSMSYEVLAQNALTLELVFDRYRSETSWELTDNQGNVMDSGGDYGPDFASAGEYPHPPIDIANLPDGDYVFTVFDDYPDGMCCQYGNGSYTLIQNSNNAVIATGGAFGAEESTAFTLPFVAPSSGCTDPEAVNYNPDAETDDGSCEYLVSPLSINLEVFATGLSNPVAMKHAGDDRLFVVEQNSGRVRILDSDGNILGNFIDIGSSISTGGERGLLGIAFHPNYSENGYFYLNYTNTQGNTEIKRFTVSDNDPNIADNLSGLTIIRINQPFGNHNAGDLEFGPDGYLYIPMGDGGNGGDPQNYSQTTTSLLGKMLRIDVDNDDFPGDPLKNYAIPSDNPFVGNPGTLDEIWALGLRNPWRFSFDRETHDIWIADVGQNLYEEVNMQPASSTGGENYGWRCYEGFNTFNTSGCQSSDNYDFPVFEYAHNQYGWCSISGGYVYRGSNYPLLQGHYLVTDYCGGTFYAIRQNVMGEWVSLFVNDQYAAGLSGFVGFGEDVNGEMYAIRITNGTIYRIEEPCSASIPVITEDGAALTSSTAESYQWLLEGMLIEGATDQTYLAQSTGTYSVVVDAGNGCIVESDTVNVLVSSLPEMALFSQLTFSPNPSTGQFFLRAEMQRQDEMNVELYDNAGRLVHRSAIGWVSGQVHRKIDLSNLSEGVYLAKVFLGSEWEMKRLVIVR